MNYLPAISDYIMPAPNDTRYTYTKKNNRYIPDDEENNFWNSFYTKIMLHAAASDPVVNMQSAINPYFGYFGKRWHPEHKESSFHTGIDIRGNSKTPIVAIATGILEYSGYGVINGNYVMLSHPHIRTEDGFVLHSLYIHLSQATVKFSAYQKMLREISLHTHPRINVHQDDVIGYVGATGASSYPEGYMHVHIQCELRNSDGDIVIIDPYRILRGESVHNLTETCVSLEDYEQVFIDHAGDIQTHGLSEVWHTE